MLVATCAAGGVVGLATAGALVSTFQPSERAKAAGAPVEIDISDVAPGTMKVVEWRGKPVWILRRTPEMMASLAKTDDKVADPKSDKIYQLDMPDYAKNETRSRAEHKEVLVVVGICSHLGCSPSSRFAEGAQPSCRTTGTAVSCALATVRPSTWPRACSRTSRRRPTSTCRRTCTCPIPGS